MSMRTPILVAAALALGLGSQIGCEKTGDRNASSQSRTQTPDEAALQAGQRGDTATFVTMTGQANLAEVDAGRLAVKKTSNAEVKSFAQHMIDDHTQANAELSDLAHKKGIDMPAQADEAHQKDAARLAGMNGAEFDHAYMMVMANDHQKVVSMFEKYANEATDPDVRAFAKKMLPTLQDHLKMARALSEKLVGSSNP
jgi:putative membrane protein